MKESNQLENWMCDGKVILKGGCKSKITDFFQTKGIQGWQCMKFIDKKGGGTEDDDECNFDICKKCL